MKKFAVFDIDGTLIRWQLYHAVVDKLAKKKLLGNKAHQQLHDARMIWKRREHDKAFHDYEAKLIKVYEAALPTLNAKDFDNTVEEVAAEYKTQIYTYTKKLSENLKKQGYILIAISGSHTELVEHVARKYAFDIWIGSEYKRKDGRFTGERIIASLDKKSVLQKIVKQHHLSYENSFGVGDSKSDAPMLSMVDNPIAFNPDQELLKISTLNKWPIVIERKNVIYELRAEPNGKYTLV